MTPATRSAVANLISALDEYDAAVEALRAASVSAYRKGVDVSVIERRDAAPGLVRMALEALRVAVEMEIK